MPSLIPGYEYDIFISYRQKKNEGVRARKGEEEKKKQNKRNKIQE